MARYYSKTDVCRLLKITPRQLQHLLTVTGIVPTVASNDKRMQLVASNDLERLEAAHLEELRAYVPGLTDDESIMSDMEQIAMKMREEMAELKKRVDGLEARTSEAGLPPKGEDRLIPRRYTGFTQRDEPPSGLVYRARFAEAHGIPGGTAKGHTEAGILQETTMPHPTRANEVNHFFNEEQQAAAVAYWRTHSAGFEACPDCPHEART